MDRGILESLIGLTTEHRGYAAEPERIRVELIDSVAGLPQPPDHSLSTAAAKTADVTEAHRLVLAGEREAWGDAGYHGVERRPKLADSRVEWHFWMKLVIGVDAASALTHSPAAARITATPRTAIQRLLAA